MADFEDTPQVETTVVATSSRRKYSPRTAPLETKIRPRPKKSGAKRATGGKTTGEKNSKGGRTQNAKALEVCKKENSPAPNPKEPGRRATPKFEDIPEESNFGESGTSPTSAALLAESGATKKKKAPRKATGGCEDTTETNVVTSCPPDLFDFGNSRAAADVDGENSDIDENSCGGEKTKFGIAREIFVAVMNEVDPEWVDGNTGFKKVARHPMVTYMGALSVLNNFAVDISGFPHYRSKSALWTELASDCELALSGDGPYDLVSELKYGVDSGYVLLAARFALGRSRFMALVAESSHGKARELCEKIERQPRPFECVVANRHDEAERDCERLEAQIMEKEKRPQPSIFETMGITANVIRSILRAVDPTEEGTDTITYIKGAARLFALFETETKGEAVRTRIPDDIRQSLPFANDADLLALFEITYELNILAPASRKSYDLDDARLFFSSVERIMGRDFPLFCMQNNITFPVTDLYFQATTESLATAYMILAGYRVLFAIPPDVAGEPTEFLWSDGSSKRAIVTAGTHFITPNWGSFEQSVRVILKEGAAARGIRFTGLQSRLSSGVFIKQIFNACKPMIPLAMVTEQRKQTTLGVQVQMFLDKKCDIGDQYGVISKDLYMAYCDFCHGRGEIAKYTTACSFAKHLNSQRDLFNRAPGRHKNRTILGLRLKP